MKNFINEYRHRKNAYGLQTTLKWALHRCLLGYSYRVVCNIFNCGTNVLDLDWDVLLILDGLRADEMKNAAINRAWIDEVNTMKSVAGRSSTWMKKTFSPYRQNLSDVAYVTGNPNSNWLFDENKISRNDFGLVDEVWAYEWDDDVATIRARTITDRIISISRSDDFNRIIGHYMQPHFPSITDPIGSDIAPENLSWKNSAWNQLLRGEISSERVLKSYRKNIDYVLNDVEVVIRNVNADIAITSDHGNAIGEWGYFGHDNWPVKSILEIPWIKVKGNDYFEYKPDMEFPDESSIPTESDVEKRLQALGYKN